MCFYHPSCKKGYAFLQRPLLKKDGSFLIFCSWVVFLVVFSSRTKPLIAPPVQASDTKPAASSAKAGDLKKKKKRAICCLSLYLTTVCTF
jgi:hypothetical protein